MASELDGTTSGPTAAEHPASAKPGTVRIVTLGCAKNEVDSEEIAGVLTKAGCETVAGAKADVVVINTCGFLEASKQESIAAIRQAIADKKAGRVSKVIVAGCLAQRMGAELAREVPGADAYVGVGHMAHFDDIVRQVRTSREVKFDVAPPQHRWADVPTRARTGKPWSAYLKVSEGCDHKCTFCTIPSFRGPHRSKPMERVLEEARFLAAEGAKELCLIAQDVTQYGFDLYKEFTLPLLLRKLNEVEGIEWIRILYFYPNRLTDEVIDAIATCKKVLPYIDMPLQHAHPDTLRRMHRPWDGERYLTLIEKVRSAIPNVAIRTTFIVGFPGETDAEFECLLDFMKRSRLDRVGAFMFSREEGTPSYDYEGQVPFRIKRERTDRLMSLQQSISLEVNQGWIGRTLPVLTEQHKDGWTIGRSHRDAPDIDGLVMIPGELPLGQIVEATVTGADHYDLQAAVSEVGLGSSAAGRGRQLQQLRQAAPRPPQ